MREKGSAIYFSLVVLTVILGLILGLSAILISQIGMVRGMEHSVIAFYAANTGIEEALRILRYDPTINQRLPYTPLGRTITLNGGSVNYWIEIRRGGGTDINCNRTHYCIRSRGEFRGTQRAIEVGN